MESSKTIGLSSDKALRTCTSCKDRKRKCDKALPICSLCHRMKWTCQYAKPRHHKTTEARQLVLPTVARSHFPAVFFLDAEIFQRARLELPTSSLPIPQLVTDLVGELAAIRSVAAEYFASVHLWMPVVSRKLFYDHLLNPLCTPQPHTQLLFLCMRLLISIPRAATRTDTETEEEAYQAPIYLCAKSFFADLETAGVCSIQVLQAGIMIALYELGHGIYPAAFLTVGACARYGSAFGFDGKGKTGIGRMEDWIEIEERKRAWWAVLILDRFANLGNPTRVLATEDPDTSSVLPMDDDAWNRGVSDSDNSFTISSPASVTMGRFARFTQAAYLLGQVLRHVSDHNVETSFRNKIATQLHRTLHSLISLAGVEATIRKTEFCTQTALCYSALLILHGPHSSVASEASVGKEHYRSVTSIAAAAAFIAANFLEWPHNRPLPPDRYVSPFLLHFLYRASTVYTDLWQSARDENAFNALDSLRGAMSILSRRWNVAGAYLEILKAREATYY